MATERIRQKLSGPMNLEDVHRYESQGWRAVSVEWERELAGAAPSSVEAPPFGLQVAKDCATLEENPTENEILSTMMELIIQDGPYSFIAEQLNRRGFVTRQGAKWTAVAVFEMLPRLIEAGPKIFSQKDWHERRQRSRTAGPTLPI